jgi:dATP pyrophosphohydrolase
LVYNTAGEVLLLQRTRPKGFWQSVTGSLKWGESPQQAARRELYEETGIMAGNQLQDLAHHESFPIVPPWRSRYAPHARKNREHWFCLAVTGRRMIRLNTREHSEYRWVRAERGLQLASSWTNRKAIRSLL